MATRSPMHAYSEYVSSLRSTVRSVLADQVQASDAVVAATLDGLASSELRRLVAGPARREHGAFFTGGDVRARVAEAIQKFGEPPFFDPMCGAGDLLVAAAESLPTLANVDDTVASWSAQFFGRDISAEFVEAARLRLLLAALARHDTAGVALGLSEFGGICLGDGTLAAELSKRRGTLVMNPPFGRMAAPADCEWGSGAVSRAAVYFEQAVRQLSPGSKIIAVLPDVIRSGSNLAKFRTVIDGLMSIEEVVGLGQFDPWTDIDVFLLVGTRRVREAATASETRENQPGRWTVGPPAGSITLAEFFEVRVGPVVQSRDPMRGGWHPFLVAKDLPRSGTIDQFPRNRRFAGTTFQPPFVVVRRTDRPSKHGERAVAVCVDGSRPVAVENHLIVLRPLDGTLGTCQEAAVWLSGAEVRTFLDSRIRCRHLTTRALREVPAPPDWTRPI